MPHASETARITAFFSSCRHRIVTISFSACTLMPQKASVSSAPTRRLCSTVPPVAPAGRAAAMTSPL